MDVLSLSGLKWKSYTMRLVALHLLIILCKYYFFYTLPKTLHKHLKMKVLFLASMVPRRTYNIHRIFHCKKGSCEVSQAKFELI